MKSIRMLSLVFVIILIGKTMSNNFEKEVESTGPREDSDLNGYQITPFESRFLNGNDFQLLSGSRDAYDP
jgi:hypothetical protein